MEISGAAVVAGMRKLITADVAVFQLLDRSAHRLMTRYSPHDPYTPEGNRPITPPIPGNIRSWPTTPRESIPRPAGSPM